MPISAALRDAAASTANSAIATVIQIIARIGSSRTSGRASRGGGLGGFSLSDTDPPR